MSKSLVVALCVLVASVSLSPLVVLYAADWSDGGQLSLLVFVMALPQIVCLCWTIFQQRRSLVPSFATSPLVVSTIFMVASVLSICVLAEVGAVIDFVLVPVAGAFLALAWVQPRHADTAPTVILGVVLVPFIAWFVGRVDEYLAEGAVAAAFILACVASLGHLRRRGERENGAVAT